MFLRVNNEAVYELLQLDCSIDAAEGNDSMSAPLRHDNTIGGIDGSGVGMKTSRRDVRTFAV